MNEGIKYDEGKNRLDLLPPELILGVGEVLTYGASKYDDRNWEKGMAWSRPYGALLRHIMRWHMGHTFDEESNLRNLDHAATNIAFLQAYERRGVGTDDRPGFSSIEHGGRRYEYSWLPPEVS